MRFFVPGGVVFDHVWRLNLIRGNDANQDNPIFCMFRFWNRLGFFDQQFVETDPVPEKNSKDATPSHGDHPDIRNVSDQTGPWAPHGV